MTIGIIGSGQVAQALAIGFLTERHSVKLGTRNPQKPELVEWQAQHPGLEFDSVARVAEFGEVLVLGVKGEAAELIIKDLIQSNPNILDGKTIVDTTNPIVSGENGYPKSTNGVV